MFPFFCNGQDSYPEFRGWAGEGQGQEIVPGVIIKQDQRHLFYLKLKKKAIPVRGWLLIRTVFLLFGLFIQVGLVAVHKLIYATSCIDQLHLTRIKRVGSAGNFKFDQRIFNSIFQFYSLFGGSCRFCYKGEFIGHVLECDKPVVLWMYIFLHRFIVFDSHAFFKTECKDRNVCYNFKTFSGSFDSSTASSINLWKGRFRSKRYL